MRQTKEGVRRAKLGLASEWRSEGGDRKSESESAQNQIIRTNLVKAQIDKTQKDTLCRLCKKADKSINHVVSGCSKLAQEYKRRHDNLGKIVHWKLARKCNFEAGDKWYEHEPKSVLENEDYKILISRDFSIQTDHVIEARKPGLVVVDKKRTCKIIHFAVPEDSRFEEKEKEKIKKYQDLRRELQKIWNVKVKIIPLVVGSLGAIPKQIGTTAEIGQMQKTVLLGKARILRKVLEIKGCWLWLDFERTFQY